MRGCPRETRAKARIATPASAPGPMGRRGIFFFLILLFGKVIEKTVQLKLSQCEKTPLFLPVKTFPMSTMVDI